MSEIQEIKLKLESGAGEPQSEAETQILSELLAMKALDSHLWRQLPTKDAVAATIAEYPQHAELIADYAYLQNRREQMAASDIAAQRVEAIAAQLIQQRRAQIVLSPQFKGIFAAAKEKKLDLKGVGQRMGVGMTILAKLERRLIAVASIPKSLIEELAQELNEPVERIRLYLSGSPTLSSQASYRAKETPALRETASGVPSQEPFMEAVRTSVFAGEMTQEQGLLWNDEPIVGATGNPEG